MRVDTHSPVYCPRCGVNLSGTIGEETEEPELCEHLVFYHYSCDAGDDSWFHVTPGFSHAYLIALTESKEYKEWLREWRDTDEDSPVREAERAITEGALPAEAMCDVPYFDEVAMAVCNPKTTVLFHFTRQAFEFHEECYLCVDCSGLPRSLMDDAHRP